MTRDMNSIPADADLTDLGREVFGAPKPQKPIRGTAECRSRMDMVAQLPCVICGSRPVVVHHCIHDRFSQSRASDLETIPLCPRHHDASSTEGLHHAPATWRNMHGADHEYLPLVANQIDRMKKNTI